MAQTYKKPLKTVEIIMMCGETYTVADTAEKAIGSNTLVALEHGEKIIKWEVSETETQYIRFEAVCAWKVATSTEDVEKADPYGCEEEEATDEGNGEG